MSQCPSFVDSSGSRTSFSTYVYRCLHGRSSRLLSERYGMPVYEKSVALSVRTQINTPRHSFLPRSEEHTSELQSRFDLVCRLLLEKKNKSQQTRSVISRET